MNDEKPLSAGDISEIIALAWADEVSFEDIRQRLGVPEKAVIQLMRAQLKPGSFRLWRARVSGRKAKHLKKQRSIENTENAAVSDFFEHD